ncbi:YcaO-like family protein [Cryobacterium sp. PH29-G1]|uniref:YcaO-like family protein n=1 Tax=Cryobacterium sp. PH29-G1 TaxID=3046211 RepID=UPI0024BB4C5D|nr:YcaO-like family protein [Cryobacterium sp. PH29-G1]MDJ0350246.1 YcaO-like family protein [Cryobacterium sp. PH29-G1]
MTASTARPLLGPESLVDAETGIIRSVRSVLRPDGAPSAYTSVTAEVADARRLGDWPADRVSLGTTFGDTEQAWIAAVAEGMERYCGNFLPEHLDPAEQRVGSAAELRGQGLRVIDLAALPQFAPWQLAAADFPYQALTDTVTTLWTRCHELLPGRDRETPAGDQTAATWLPASLVYLNWRQRRCRYLPRVHHLNYAGIATGQGNADAQDRAVLECVERDALELWWHLDGPTRGIDPASVPQLTEAMSGCDLHYWLVELPSEFAPVLAALVYDPHTGLYAAGFSCKLDPAEAARKAVLEAVHTWIYTAGLQDADGWVFQAVAARLMAPGLYLEHRADRRYLDAVGENFARVRDLGAHVQVWLDPRVHPLAERFTQPSLGTVSITQIPSVSQGWVYERLAAGGHRVFTRDLTTSDVARTSLRVARVVVTGLVPNAPAAFAYLGSERFRTAARERGWRSTDPVDPDDFTLTPPPHM